MPREWRGAHWPRPSSRLDNSAVREADPQAAKADAAMGGARDYEMENLARHRAGELNDAELGMANLKNAMKDPSAIAQMAQMLKDPNAMAKLKQMMADPAFQQQAQRVAQQMQADGSMPDFGAMAALTTDGYLRYGAALRSAGVSVRVAPVGRAYELVYNESSAPLAPGSPFDLLYHTGAAGVGAALEAYQVRAAGRAATLPQAALLHNYGEPLHVMKQSGLHAHVLSARGCARRTGWRRPTPWSSPRGRAVTTCPSAWSARSSAARCRPGCARHHPGSNARPSYKFVILRA